MNKSKYYEMRCVEYAVSENLVNMTQEKGYVCFETKDGEEIDPRLFVAWLRGYEYMATVERNAGKDACVEYAVKHGKVVDCPPEANKVFDIDPMMENR